MPESKTEKFEIIGNESDAARGILVSGADYGSRKVATVANELVTAANRLAESGHTVLHFTGVNDPREGVLNGPRQMFQHILVLGQRPAEAQ